MVFVIALVCQCAPGSANAIQATSGPNSAFASGSNNGLDPQSATAVGKALAAVTSLTSLDIRRVLRAVPCARELVALADCDCEWGVEGVT